MAGNPHVVLLEAAVVLAVPVAPPVAGTDGSPVDPLLPLAVAPIKPVEVDVPSFSGPCVVSTNSEHDGMRPHTMTSDSLVVRTIEDCFCIEFEE